MPRGGVICNPAFIPNHGRLERSFTLPCTRGIPSRSLGPGTRLLESRSNQSGTERRGLGLVRRQTWLRQSTAMPLSCRRLDPIVARGAFWSVVQMGGPGEAANAAKSASYFPPLVQVFSIALREAVLVPRVYGMVFGSLS